MVNGPLKRSEMLGIRCIPGRIVVRFSETTQALLSAPPHQIAAALSAPQFDNNRMMNSGT
jgi:hypothetical protein